VGKSWVDFYDGDRSRADIRYVLYLLRKGKDEEDIMKLLQEESEDIMERKKGHLEDYLQRTIKKAFEYID
jgi:DNA polymerase III delta prime subunit